MWYETHFVKPIVGKRRDYKDFSNPLFETRISYLNYSGEEVKVACRNGLKFSIKSNTAFGRKDFIIRVEMYMSETTKLEILNQVNNATDRDSDELKVMKQFIDQSTMNKELGQYEMILEYPVELDDIKRKGGVAYIEDCDVMLGVGVSTKVLTHPHSSEGRIRDSFVEPLLTEGFSSDYVFVENSGKINKLFLRLGNKVFTLNAVKDNSREEGVYIRNSEESNIVTKVDLSDDLLNYGIYKTYLEANDLNKEVMDMKYKNELATIENELKGKNIELTRIRGELDKQKIEYDKNKIELEAKYQQELRQLDLEMKKNELLQAERKNSVKDYYEERSYQRKDSSEWMKMLPTVIVGIGSILLAFKTFGSGK